MTRPWQRNLFGIISAEAAPASPAHPAAFDTREWIPPIQIPALSEALEILRRVERERTVPPNPPKFPNPSRLRPRPTPVAQKERWH